MIIAPSHPAFKMLDHLADATNPLLGVALIVGLILLWRRDKSNCARIFFAALVSIVLIQLIHQLFEIRYDVWGHGGMNFSTHAAMTIALCIPLVLLWKRLWWLFLLIFIAYDALMMMLAFHSLGDIITTTIVIFPLCLLCHFVARRKRAIAPE